MTFNAFARFGHVSFSGRELLGKKIYEAMKRATGPAFDDSFNGSHTQAKLYAQAMGIASTSLMLDRVKNNAIAKKATDLLPNLEKNHGIIPYQGESKHQRRARLHARMLLARGATYAGVWEIMDSLLGDDFASWAVAEAATLVRFPDTAADAKLVGNYVPAGTQARIVQTQETIFPGTQKVAVTELTPKSGELSAQAMVGRTFLAEPDSESRRETCTISDVTLDGDSLMTFVTATFSNVHDVGTLFTTQYFPTWRSNAQHHFFELALDAAKDPEKRRIVDDELRRVLKGVATWSLGVTGGIAPDEGLVGVTEIGDDQDDLDAPIRDIIGDKLEAYYGAHASDWKQDGSGNGHHLSVSGDEPTRVDIDDITGIRIDQNTILSSTSLDDVASGTDKPFAVVAWVEWVSGDQYLWWFQDGGTHHRWEAISSGTDYRIHRDGEVSGTETIGTTRFLGHSFTAAGSASNIMQVDDSITNPALNVASFTPSFFKIGGGFTGVFKVARLVVCNSDLTQAEMTALKDFFDNLANWNS